MNERELFIAALQLGDPKARAAFLDQACGTNQPLRGRVESLLSEHEKLGSFLEQPASRPELDATLSLTPDGENPIVDHNDPLARQGTILAGKYKLLQQIGEGGMGTVWMADQTEPIKRRVAVKLIRAERGNSATILARFEAERQAIALMDHPHIAKLLEAGSTKEGSPYFVMELVKGVPLTEYCDTHRLSIADRLKLFVQICGAVQHAHQKGIIHRDLKPSNVLVESHDGTPMPRVIDFGLAKAVTGMQLSEETFFTAFGSVMGTPGYMAPEQASFNAIDIDTRADIYALGVILYELLTGSTPLTREAIKKAALDEILRLIREQEPPTPSSRLSSSESRPSIAANRQIEPQKLGRFIKGELDWIVLKSLSKDRDRRYETASGFAKDIERFLNHEPVTAGPPSTRYRVRKFVQRNRGQVVAAGLVFSALLLGIAGMTWGLIEAKRQERIALTESGLKEDARLEAVAAQKAEANRAEGERLAKIDAQEANELTAQRLGQIEKINNTVFDIFAEFDLTKVKEGKEPVERVLAQKLIEAGKKLDAKAIHDPLVLANLHHRLGRTLTSLGEAPAAIEFTKSAVDIRTAQLGADHPDTFASWNSHGEAFLGAGTPDLALTFMEETLRRAKLKLGPDHPETLSSMGNLAEGYRSSSNLTLAIPLLEETLNRRQAKLGRDDPATGVSMNNLALAYIAGGHPEKAFPLLKELLERATSRFGPDHPTSLIAMHNLAEGYLQAGNLELALPSFKKTLELMQAILGTDHPSTLSLRNQLALGYRAVGKLDLAMKELEETLKISRIKLGNDHDRTHSIAGNLALVYLEMGKPELAIPSMRDNFQRNKAKFGPDHAATLASMHNLASAYQSVKRLDLALPLFEDARKRSQATHGRDHPSTLRSTNNLAMCYHALGKLDLALPLFEEAYEITKRKLGPDHPDTLASMGNLASIYRTVKKLDLAMPLYEESLKLKTAKLGIDHPSTLASMGNLALAYKGAGKLDEAISLLEKTLELRKVKMSVDHPDTLTIMANLALTYSVAGQMDKSVRLYEETLALKKAKLGANHTSTLSTMDNLALMHWRMKRLDQSISIRLEALRILTAKLGRQHPETLRMGANLGACYRDAGRLAEALPLLEAAHLASKQHASLRWVGPELLAAYLKDHKKKEADDLLKELLDLAHKTSPKDSVQLAAKLRSIGVPLIAQRAFSEAEGTLREALEISEKHEPDTWWRFYTSSILGRALLGQKKYADAESFLLKGQEGMKARVDQCDRAGIDRLFAPAKITEALDDLIELYTATNRPDEAKKWQAERAKYSRPRAPMPREVK